MNKGVESFKENKQNGHEIATDSMETCLLTVHTAPLACDLFTVSAGQIYISENYEYIEHPLPRKNNLLAFSKSTSEELPCVYFCKVIKDKPKILLLILYQMDSDGVNKRKRCAKFFMRGLSAEENKSSTHTVHA